jgi:hypothetical protein
MSGTSLPPGSSPNKLLPPIGDQPFVDPKTGQLTMFGFQMLQRLYSYLGQPGSATGGTPSGETVTEGIATAQAMAIAAAFAPGNEGLYQSRNNTFVFGFPPPPTDGGVIALQQGSTYTQGVVAIGSLLVLQGQTLDGQVWAPLTNGDPPGDDLIGYPDGQVKGPTLVALPNGSCVMVRIR